MKKTLLKIILFLLVNVFILYAYIHLFQSAHPFWGVCIGVVWLIALLLFPYKKIFTFKKNP